MITSPIGRLMCGRAWMMSLSLGLVGMTPLIAEDTGTTADQAKVIAQSAEKAANQAKEIAQSAEKAANAAKEALDAVKRTADDARSIAQAAEKAAIAAKEASDAVRTDLAVIKAAVMNRTGAAFAKALHDTADKLSKGAAEQTTQSVQDALTGLMSRIAAISGAASMPDLSPSLSPFSTSDFGDLTLDPSPISSPQAAMTLSILQREARECEDQKRRHAASIELKREEIRKKLERAAVHMRALDKALSERAEARRQLDYADAYARTEGRAAMVQRLAAYNNQVQLATQAREKEIKGSMDGAAEMQRLYHEHARHDVRLKYLMTLIAIRTRGML